MNAAEDACCLCSASLGPGAYKGLRGKESAFFCADCASMARASMATRARIKALGIAPGSLVRRSAHLQTPKAVRA